MGNGEECMSSLHEQLYLIEVFVISISLLSEKIGKEDPSALAIDVKFIDYPVFEIQQARFELTKKDKGKGIARIGVYHKVNFNAGEVYLFTANPNTLVRRMKSQPILLNVCKIKGKISCPQKTIKDHLAHTSIPLTGCLCDQLTMADNEYNRLPESYTINNTFCLSDEDQKPAGVIAMVFSLTCFGKYTISQFCTLEKSLLLKNYGSASEFQCIKIPLGNEHDRRAEEEETKACLDYDKVTKSELDSPPKAGSILGLALVCQELAKQDD